MGRIKVLIFSLIVATAVFGTPLDSVLIATFGGRVCQGDTFFQLAMFFEPQFMRRGWFKYAGMPIAFFDTCEWAAESAAARGVIFEGGVQAANINPNHGGWLWPSEEDSIPPYAIPSEICSDLATRNTSGNFYYVNNIFGNPLFHAAVNNENWISYCLWWAYRQAERGAKSLEFDEVSGAYSYAFSDSALPDTANPNDGYDDYALGTANFCRRPGVIFFADLDSAPQVVYASAEGTGTTPELAIDGDFSTRWSSFQPDGQTLTVDLGRSRRICQIYLAFGDVVPREFSVQFWDGAHWQDFSPPAADTTNSQQIRSFLVEQQWAKMIRFITPDSAEISELQLFGDGFRQYLLRRFCTDSGWTATDPRWESQMLVPLDDSTVCPDGTMNSFDYRAYLRHHGWTNNPFGGTPSMENLLDPPNPFFYLWFPHKILAKLRRELADYPETLSYLQDLYEQSFDARRRNQFWKTLVDSLRTFEDSLGENLILTHNGSAKHPMEDTDYLILNMTYAPGEHSPSETDSQRIILDARYTILNVTRETIYSAWAERGENLLVIAFLDFGHSGFPFYHIGGKDAPADQRAQYILTYVPELYAAGSKFAVPLTGNENFYIWLDTLSDGTCLAEKIKPLCDFILENGWLYLGEWEIS
ncbi:MAG TPA: discoidin domain-containing protein, partial [candidate division Zixibacteria bacterium]|nr:discoidin domain-containing protein [candidate division Zixibacteria bacterium]